MKGMQLPFLYIYIYFAIIDIELHEIIAKYIYIYIIDPKTISKDSIGCHLFLEIIWNYTIR